MKPIEDLIRQDVVLFLNGYDDETDSIADVREDVEVLVEEIMETVTEKIHEAVGRILK